MVQTFPNQKLLLWRHLGLKSTLKDTYPKLSMLIFSQPPSITYTCYVPSSFETSFILFCAQIAPMPHLWCFPDPSRPFWLSSQFPTHPYHFQSRAYTSGDLALWFSPISYRSCPGWLCIQATFFSYKLLLLLLLLLVVLLLIIIKKEKHVNWSYLHDTTSQSGVMYKLTKQRWQLLCILSLWMMGWGRMHPCL